jgi:sulfatase modifying factor 1
MIPVPAGTFQRDGTSTNTSTVSAFSMSEKEITAEQFTAVTGLTPSTSFTGVVNGPVQMTNWYHALVFCNKLSMREGLTPVYTIGGSTDPAVWIAANGGIVPITSNATWNAATPNWAASGYRLPTEMEWMWAAMGATSDRSNGYAGTGTNTTGYARSGDIVGGVNTGGYTKGYAGSTELADAQLNIGDYAWYSVNAGSTTHPVGTKAANELGLYDMSGNVAEWCLDWYADPYPTGALNNYRGAVSGTYRVTRGGGWGSSAVGCTVAFRNNNNPYSQYDKSGFRVVRP